MSDCPVCHGTGLMPRPCDTCEKFKATSGESCRDCEHRRRVQEPCPWCAGAPGDAGARAGAPPSASSGR